MLTDQEERLDANEQEFFLTILHEDEAVHLQRLKDMDNTLEERHSERSLVDGSEWKDHIATKFDEYMQSMAGKFQQPTDEHSEAYEQRIEEMSSPKYGWKWRQHKLLINCPLP
jgi:Ribonuclease G/E